MQIAKQCRKEGEQAAANGELLGQLRHKVEFDSGRQYRTVYSSVF